MSRGGGVFYLALPCSGKQIFLALVSNSLTVYGRALFLDLSGEVLTKALKGLNELQHQISQHIVALGLNRDRYPDDMLWKILEETAANYGLAEALEGSIRFAESRSFWGEPSSN